MSDDVRRYTFDADSYVGPVLNSEGPVLFVEVVFVLTGGEILHLTLDPETFILFREECNRLELRR